MIASPKLAEEDEQRREDHYVHLHGVTWADYQRLLELRGEHSVPRITFLEGTLEIMSPSVSHESIKSTIGCLVEVWCLERGVEFSTLGSWTLQNEESESGAGERLDYDWAITALMHNRDLAREADDRAPQNVKRISVPRPGEVMPS